MAIQTQVLCASFNSDSSTATIQEVEILIYDDVLEDDGSYLYSTRITLRIGGNHSFGIIRNDVVSMLSSLVASYDGIDKSFVTWPSLLRAEEKIDANGTVTSRKEFY